MILRLAGDVSLNLDQRDSLINRSDQLPFSQEELYCTVHASAKALDIYILCMTETWLFVCDTTSFLAEVTPDSYVLSHKLRVGKRSGGVGFFLKNHVYHTINDTNTFGSFEYMHMTVKSMGQIMDVVCLYHPPGLSTTSFF